MTKVLIFETNHAFAVELRSGLASLGCIVQVFKEGATGLMAAVASPPDMILLSVELPRMNGFSVCNKIKKDPSLQHIPLIILSEQSTPETFAQHRKLRTCAQDYVHKPIGFVQLLERMRRLIPTLGTAPESTSDGPFSSHGPISSRRSFASAAGSESYSERGPASSRRGMPRQRRPSSTHYTLDETPPPSAPIAPAAEQLTSPAMTSARATTLKVGDLQEQSTLPELSLVDRRQHATLARQTQPRLQTAAIQQALQAKQAPLGSPAESDDGRAVVATGHESFQLRELLRRKEKEVVGLREQLQARERQLLDLRDEHLARDRSSSGLDDQVLQLERRLAESRKQCEALSAQKELDKKRLQDVRDGAKRVAQQLNSRAIELRDVKKSHGQQILQLERAHAESMRRLEAQYRSNLNQNESLNQKESDALQHQLTSMQGQLQAASDAIAIRDETIENERKRAQQFEAELHKASNALVDANSGASESQAELDMLRDDMSVLFKEREEEARRRKASDEHCQRLEDQLDRLRSQAATLVEDRDRAIQDAERARLDRNAVVAERDAVVAERNAATASHAAAQHQSDSLVSELNNLRHQNQQAHSERSSLVAERDAALAECDAGIEERSALENRIRLLSNERDALAKAVEQEHDEKDALRQQAQEMRAKLEEVERQGEKWQQARDTLQTEHDAALQQAQRNYQGELFQKLAEAAEESDERLKNLRQQLEGRASEYDELARSNEELVAQLTAVKHQRQSALQRLERSERQWRKDRQALRAAGEALAQIANRVESVPIDFDEGTEPTDDADQLDDAD